MPRRVTSLLIIPAVWVGGCQPAVYPAPDAGSPARHPDRQSQAESQLIEKHGPGTPPLPINRVYAYINGEAVWGETLFPALLEAAGGDVLQDLVLDRLVERRLGAQGVSLTPAMIDAERTIVSQTLAGDEDQAARMLRELRQRRGLGDARFEALLRRNAGLRALVKDRVTVTEAALQQAYRLHYGPSRRVRLLLCDTLADAQRLRDRATQGGEPFGELAALHSVDPSAAQGGLLSPIRPDDTSYPAALRDAAASLAVGQVSQPFALEGRFALVRVEEELAGTQGEHPFPQVRAEMERAVRLRAERAMMQQTARELLSAADVLVLDPSLKLDWERQRDALLNN